MTLSRRIAILKPSALGDIAHALPALSLLRMGFPDAYLAWVVNRAYEPILRNHPCLNAIIPFDRGAFKQGLWRGCHSHGDFLRRLRGERFDTVIDLQGLLRTGLMALASGARLRVGLRSAREGARLAYTRVVDDTQVVEHATERYCRAVAAVLPPGSEQATRRFVLALDSAACRQAGEVLAKFPRPWVAVVVGARWETKRWPTQHFAVLLRQVFRDFGGTAIFLGIPEEASLARDTAAMLDTPSLQLAGRTTLPELTAYLHQADVVLGNDTGPVHLAVALGRPVVTPYTCTRVATTGPYGQARHAVATTVACAGSLLRQCDKRICFDELTPDRLGPVISHILTAWQRKHPAASYWPAVRRTAAS
jgi:lipopolysaccharide heptosyltransferase I